MGIDRNINLSVHLITSHESEKQKQYDASRRQLSWFPPLHPQESTDVTTRLPRSLIMNPNLHRHGHKIIRYQRRITLPLKMNKGIHNNKV